MNRISTLAVGLLASMGVAVDPRRYIHQSPGPDDVRSPCPGLNTLANHNFFAHSGKNISTLEFAKGCKEGYGFGQVPAILTLALGFAPEIPDVYSFRFDLDELSQHGMFREHDGSISRKDAGVGDFIHFDPATWNRTKQLLGNKEYFDARDMGRARDTLLQEQRKGDPKFHYDMTTMISTSLEDGILLSALGDGTKARMDQVNYFLENERMPTELGWTGRESFPVMEIPVTMMLSITNMPAMWPVVGFDSIFQFLTPRGILGILEQRLGGPNAIPRLRKLFSDFRDVASGDGQDVGEVNVFLAGLGSG